MDYKTVLTQLLAKAESGSFALCLHKYLFPPQLKFVQDPSRNKVAVCSRRAGKSTAIAADLVATASSFPECTALYVTQTRSDAKKIIWKEVLNFNRIHSLGGVPNISELTLSLPNGSLVRLASAKDQSEVEKIRGQLPPLKKVFIDEAQSIRDSILTNLIDDVLEPALLDYDGTISLLGTPSPIAAGYFYRLSHNLKEDGTPLSTNIWSIHHWTFFNNPFIPIKSNRTHEQALDAVLKRRGVTRDHPSIQREFYGLWVNDTESLLIHYNEKKNHYDELPKRKTAYNYILGIDLGFDDADSLSLVAWHEDSPITYLVEEKTVAQQGLTELVGQIQELAKRYDISKMVIDQGGLGKKLAEEMRRQHGIPVQAADKARKMEAVAFLNDALRTGRFMAKRNSRFAQDSYLVEIDKDKSTPDKIVVSEKFHSDICLSENTLVETIQGQKRITEIEVGDFVLTRKGYFPVEWSGQTGIKDLIKLEFSNGKSLESTEDHLVYDATQECFVPANALRYGFKPCIYNACENQWVEQKLSFLMAPGIQDIQIQKTHHIEIITPDVYGNATELKSQKITFIALFGNIITDQFPKVFQFIIKITIHSIINWRIYSFYLMQSICGYIGWIKLHVLTLRSKWRIWMQSDLLPGVGINRGRADNGIPSMQNEFGRHTEQKSWLNVRYAIKTFFGVASQHFTPQKSCAPTNVEQKREETLGLIISTLCVNGVELQRREINTGKYIGFVVIHVLRALETLKQYLNDNVNIVISYLNHAHDSIKSVQKYVRVRLQKEREESNVVLVRREHLSKNSKVYNLKIKGPPEFYANGILVHNCDAVLYAFRESPAYSYELPVEKPKPNTPEYFKAEEEDMFQRTLEQLQRQQKNEDPYSAF